MALINIFGDFKANTIDQLNLSKELSLLLDAGDINLVNFEAPVVSDGKPIKKSGPNIHQHVNAPQWLEEKGFNAVSLANNHAMDFGVTGLTKTKNAFNAATVMGGRRLE